MDIEIITKRGRPRKINQDALDKAIVEFCEFKANGVENITQVEYCKNKLDGKIGSRTFRRRMRVLSKFHPLVALFYIPRVKQQGNWSWT